MSRQLDVLFVECNPGNRVYQDLANEFKAIETPTWSLLLAQSCRAKGFGVNILDCNALNLDDNKAIELIRDFNPKLVCFVVYSSNPNGGTTNMCAAFSLCNSLKEIYPKFKTCFVGSHTSALPKEVLSNSNVDFVLLNEGVYALHNLLKTDLEDVKNVKGIGHKTDGVINLNEPEKIVSQSRMEFDLPGYAWDLLPYDKKPFDLYRAHLWHGFYKKENLSPFASLYTSLGCVMKCLAGDTPINTIYGKIPIKELAEKYNTIPVYTYNKETQELFITDAINIQKTGEKQKLVRVEFDDGTHIDCTPDHKFLVFKWGNKEKGVKEWAVEAKDLKPKQHIRAFKENVNTHLGYMNIAWRRKRNKRRCRLVMEYKIGRKLTRIEQVHHKDHNKLNDHPDNLEYCANAQEHFDKHPEISERMKNDNPSKYWTEESKKKMSVALTGKKRTLEQRLKYSESKKGEKNPNYTDGHSVGRSTRLPKEINHRIVSVTEIEGEHDTYCMTVPSTGWFFANNVLVKNCDFCMINILNRTNNNENISAADSAIMRFWPTEFILKEFDKLQSYNVNTVRIADELFFLNQRYFGSLLSSLIDRKYTPLMWAYSRVNTVKKQHLELFKNANVQWIALGIEAANRQIRREVDKGTYQDVDIREIVDEIHGHDINVIANYIYGLPPSESMETMQETYNLSVELNTAAMNCYTCAALPGSPLYLKAKQENWELPTSYEGWSFLSYETMPLPTNYLKPWEILKFRDEAWHNWHSRPDYLKMIETKFGLDARQNIEKLTRIKLRRKLLED